MSGHNKRPGSFLSTARPVVCIWHTHGTVVAGGRRGRRRKQISAERRRPISQFSKQGPGHQTLPTRNAWRFFPNLAHLTDREAPQAKLVSCSVLLCSGREMVMETIQTRRAAGAGFHWSTTRGRVILRFTTQPEVELLTYRPPGYPEWRVPRPCFKYEIKWVLL